MKEDVTYKLTLFNDILKEESMLYARKSQDYGDSFGESFEKFGVAAGLIRMGDKYNRLVNLCSKVEIPNFEGIEDTLIDLANYANMTLLEVREMKKEGKQNEN